MTSLNVPDQCSFLSINASFILLLAGKMASGQTGPAVPAGMTKTERFRLNQVYTSFKPSIYLVYTV